MHFVRNELVSKNCVGDCMDGIIGVGGCTDGIYGVGGCINGIFNVVDGIDGIIDNQLDVYHCFDVMIRYIFIIVFR